MFTVSTVTLFQPIEVCSAMKTFFFKGEFFKHFAGICAIHTPRITAICCRFLCKHMWTFWRIWTALSNDGTLSFNVPILLLDSFSSTVIFGWVKHCYYYSWWYLYIIPKYFANLMGVIQNIVCLLFTKYMFIFPIKIWYWGIYLIDSMRYIIITIKLYIPCVKIQ